MLSSERLQRLFDNYSLCPGPREELIDRLKGYMMQVNCQWGIVNLNSSNKKV